MIKKDVSKERIYGKAGNQVLSDTMKAVREAEQKADEIRAKAQADAQEILREAQMGAKNYLEKAAADEKQKAVEMMQKSADDSEERKKKAMQEVDKEIAVFRKAASVKEQQAVDGVIAHLTGE